MTHYTSNADLPSDMFDDMAADAQAEATAQPVGDRLERLSVLAEQLRVAQIALYETDKRMEEIERHERKLREVDIPELMKECNMREFKLHNGIEIKVQPDLKCGISEERKEAAFAWLREHKLGGIIKRALELEFGKGEEQRASVAAEALRQCGFSPTVAEKVHWQTLKATLKEEREKGNDVPADLFGLFEFQTTKLEFPPGVEKPKKPRAKK